MQDKSKCVPDSHSEDAEQKASVLTIAIAIFCIIAFHQPLYSY